MASRKKPSAEAATEEGKVVSTQKPWRTIALGRHTGRFTRAQAEEAVRAVKEKRERRAARSVDGRSKERNDAE